MNIRKIAANTDKENERKNLLLGGLSDTLSPICDDIFKRTCAHRPPTVEKNTELIIKAASDLNIQYHKNKIVSLGQKPFLQIALKLVLSETIL